MHRAAIGVKEKREEMLFIPIDWLFPTHSKVQKASKAWVTGLEGGAESRDTSHSGDAYSHRVVSGEDEEVDRLGRRLTLGTVREDVVCCSTKKPRKSTQGFYAEWLFRVLADLVLSTH